MEIFRRISSWLFLLGVIIAMIAGVIVGANWYQDSQSYIAAVLGVLGFIVGILSFFAIGQITKERVPTFLIGALILVVIGTTSSLYSQTWQFGSNTAYVTFFTSITQYLAYFAAPAAGLLAIRAIWDAGKTEEIEKVIPKIPVK
jgi:hypothetical protein